jgi:hypothetical protein
LARQKADNFLIEKQQQESKIKALANDKNDLENKLIAR